MFQNSNQEAMGVWITAISIVEINSTYPHVRTTSTETSLREKWPFLEQGTVEVAIIILEKMNRLHFTI